MTTAFAAGLGPLGCGASGPPLCPGVRQAGVGVTGGSAMVTLNSAPLGFSLGGTSFSITGGGLETNGGDGVELVFDEWDSSGNDLWTFWCSGASLSALNTPGQRSLSDVCGVATSLAPTAIPIGPAAQLDLHGPIVVLDLTSVPGTLVTTSTLDSNGNGTVTVRLDIPSVSLQGMCYCDASAPTVDLSVVGLVGTETFADGPCPPRGGGWP